MLQLFQSPFKAGFKRLVSNKSSIRRNSPSCWITSIPHDPLEPELRQVRTSLIWGSPTFFRWPGAAEGRVCIGLHAGGSDGIHPNLSMGKEVRHQHLPGMPEVLGETQRCKGGKNGQIEAKYHIYIYIGMNRQFWGTPIYENPHI